MITTQSELRKALAGYGLMLVIAKDCVGNQGRTPESVVIEHFQIVHNMRHAIDDHETLVARSIESQPVDNRRTPE